MRNSKMPGLPQPYNLRPKRQQSLLTTPMKKLLVYFLALFCIGFFIYELSHSSRQEKTYSLDTEAAITRKTIQKQQKQQAEPQAVANIAAPAEVAAAPAAPAAPAADLAALAAPKVKTPPVIESPEQEARILPFEEPQVVQQKAVGPDGVGIDANIAAKKPSVKGIHA